MTTVKELKEWLNRFPGETVVKFGFQQKAPMWESYGSVEFKSPELTDSDYGDGWNFIDFRKSKDSSHFGKSYLELGEKD